MTISALRASVGRSLLVRKALIPSLLGSEKGVVGSEQRCPPRQLSTSAQREGGSVTLWRSSVSEKESKGCNDSAGCQGVLAVTCLIPAKQVLNHFSDILGKLSHHTIVA